jgi:hypothetical protein
MSYQVSFGGFDGNGRPTLAALERPDPFREITLEEALSHACRLVSEGKPDVQISDDEGHSIFGDKLFACCVGTKRLSKDLRVL